MGGRGHLHHSKTTSSDPAGVSSFFLTTVSEPAGNGASNSGNALNYTLLEMPTAGAVRGELPWMQEASLRVNVLPV